MFRLFFFPSGENKKWIYYELSFRKKKRFTCSFFFSFLLFKLKVSYSFHSKMWIIGTKIFSLVRYGLKINMFFVSIETILLETKDYQACIHTHTLAQNTLTRTHTQVYTHKHIHSHTHTHTYTHKQTHTHIHMCADIWSHTHTHAQDINNIKRVLSLKLPFILRSVFLVIGSWSLMAVHAGWVLAVREREKERKWKRETGEEVHRNFSEWPVFDDMILKHLMTKESDEYRR